MSVSATPNSASWRRGFDGHEYKRLTEPELDAIIASMGPDLAQLEKFAGFTDEELRALEQLKLEE